MSVLLLPLVSATVIFILADRWPGLQRAGDLALAVLGSLSRMFAVLSLTIVRGVNDVYHEPAREWTVGHQPELRALPSLVAFVQLDAASCLCRTEGSSLTNAGSNWPPALACNSSRAAVRESAFR